VSSEGLGKLKKFTSSGLEPVKAEVTARKYTKRSIIKRELENAFTMF
jgi:hypothetical protein